MDVSENYVEKRLLKIFDKRWSLDGVNTLIKNQREILNFVVWWSWHCVVEHNRTQVNDATAVTLSVKMF